MIEESGACLLIDDGLNFKTLSAGFAAYGLELKALAGVLVTHSHVDHTSGLAPLLKKFPETVIYANQMTEESIVAQTGVDENAFACFENGQSFEVGPFSVMAFSIPHDTSDPVGYVVRCGNETYFHGTDIGTPLDSIGAWLSEADYATLESNHDPVMLWQSGRPPSLIQRISGPRGHLSNDQAAELVKRFASPKLKKLFLAHLSRDCNAPHLALAAMRETLTGMGRMDVEVKVLDP